MLGWLRRLFSAAPAVPAKRDERFLTPLQAEQAKYEEALIAYNTLISECEAVRMIYNATSGTGYASRYIELQKQIGHWKTRLQIAEARIKDMQKSAAEKEIKGDAGVPLGLPILPPLEKPLD